MSSNSDVSSHNYGVPLGRKEVEHNDIPESVQAALVSPLKVVSALNAPFNIKF